MKVIIEAPTNGYILRNESNNEDEAEIEVFEETQGDEECFTRLAIQLSEIFVRAYDKFGANNVHITWDKRGHKLE